MLADVSSTARFGSRLNSLTHGIPAGCCRQPLLPRLRQVHRRSGALSRRRADLRAVPAQRLRPHHRPRTLRRRPLDPVQLSPAHARHRRRGRDRRLAHGGDAWGRHAGPRGAVPPQHQLVRLYRGRKGVQGRQGEQGRRRRRRELEGGAVGEEVRRDPPECRNTGVQESCHFHWYVSSTLLRPPQPS